MADALPIAADVQTKKGYLMNGSLVVPIEVIIKAIEESSPGAFGDISDEEIEVINVQPRAVPGNSRGVLGSVVIQFRKSQAK